MHCITVKPTKLWTLELFQDSVIVSCPITAKYLAWVSGVSGEKGKDGSEKGRELNGFVSGLPQKATKYQDMRAPYFTPASKKLIVLIFTAGLYHSQSDKTVNTWNISGLCDCVMSNHSKISGHAHYPQNHI